MTDEVKVVSLKPGLRKKMAGKADTYDDGPPGYNTTNEVRSAQRNLLACAIAKDVVGVIPYEDVLGDVTYKLDNENYDHIINDVMDMVTPNTAYMTGPPSMGQIKESFSDSGKTRAQRDDYWSGQRGGHDT